MNYSFADCLSRHRQLLVLTICLLRDRQLLVLTISLWIDRQLLVWTIWSSRYQQHLVYKRSTALRFDHLFIKTSTTLCFDNLFIKRSTTYTFEAVGCVGYVSVSCIEKEGWLVFGPWLSRDQDDDQNSGLISLDISEKEDRSFDKAVPLPVMYCIVLYCSGKLIYSFSEVAL